MKDHNVRIKYSRITEIILNCLLIVTVSCSKNPAPLMNCSSQLTAFNISQPLSPSTKLFLDPILHECIRAHPYNTEQLPLRVGERRVPIEMTYNFFFTNLLMFESDGTIGFKAFVRFMWRDLNRSWNFSQIPIKKVRLPFSEVWTPLFSLANCESDICLILPHNRTNVGVDYNGTVSLVVQLKQHATCVMNLRVDLKSNLLKLITECYE